MKSYSSMEGLLAAKTCCRLAVAMHWQDKEALLAGVLAVDVCIPQSLYLEKHHPPTATLSLVFRWEKCHRKFNESLHPLASRLCR